MKVLFREEPEFAAALQAMLKRDAFSDDIDSAVAAITEDVRLRGDEAVCEYALKFDKATLVPGHFKVTEEEWAAAIEEVSPDTRAAIDMAVAHIQEFARKRIPQPWSFSPRPGVTLGEQFHPMERVGCYVPGGTAPLISTVCHTAGIAVAAGVREVIVCTPPGPDGQVNPNILYACKAAGVSAVYRLGGVYAVAAMAYGTASVPKVEKVCGPGNAYVAAAKRRIYGDVALDLVAGPSEIMIIADEKANPAYVAADILSQAEHGSGREQAVLVSPSKALLEATQAEIERQAALLKRQFCVTKVLEHGVFLVQSKDLEEAAAIASSYAPEHLELQVESPDELAPKITASGAIFLGYWTPEPVGDFTAGPSHVLPTGGTGRFFNGLTVEAFFRRSSLLKYDREALLKELPAIRRFAECEGLDAHGRSAIIRGE